MAGRLAAILAAKREEVERLRRATPLADMQARAAAAPPPRGFRAALCAASGGGRLAVVAEAKAASPSAGRIAPVGYDAGAVACGYATAGATCVSVLTDRGFFAGADAHLVAARAACPLPVLRKDFIIDPWQVAQTRALGADCMLLIVAALAPGEVRDLAGLGLAAGLDVLVEVHGAAEVDTALAADTGLVGINNRDLATFATDLATTERLAPALAGEGRMLVAESALRTGADAARAAAAGPARCSSARR